MEIDRFGLELIFILINMFFVLVTCAIPFLSSLKALVLLTIVVRCHHRGVSHRRFQCPSVEIALLLININIDDI